MDAHAFDGFALVDWARSACLCDVGASGQSVAVAVTDDGSDALWIVDDAELHAEHPRHGNGDQAHEQLGPLPAWFRARIAQIGAPGAAYWREVDGRWLPVYLCGRPTKKKRPCRIPVDQAGGACEWHRGVQPEAVRRAAP
jgi:hypothetical protein